MFLLGTLVDGLLIAVGTILGKIFKDIPENMKSTLMYALSVAIMILGVQMGMQTTQFLIVITSLVFGTVIGEYIDLENKLNSLGSKLEKIMGPNSSSNISQAFITSTLIFVIGAMGIIGALDSGIRGDHGILYTKGILDGFLALILTTTLGIGVIFSAFSVILYQGSIALFATQINKFVPPEALDIFINEVTATGGVMILAIGLNLSGITKIRVANMLPSVLVTAFIVWIMHIFM